MIDNPINEEIREIRRRLAAQFDNDVYRIGAEIRRRQSASGHRLVRRPRRQLRTSGATNESMHATGMSDRDSA